MVWKSIKLNDGRSIPEIGWGSWNIGDDVVHQTEQAIEAQFNHVDTAQVYKNESDVGKGIKESGLRKEIWLTTKWSGSDNKGPTQSIQESLQKLDVKSVDLYLIHSPRLTNGDPAASWREFEDLKKQGYTKSIGVSNFKIADLEAIKNASLSTPVVNQILLHPYVYAETKDLLQYHAENGIVTEAYSSLYPLTHPTSGPLTPVLKTISKARSISEAAVLFAWARSKGAVIVTTSRSKERLADYIAAGDVFLTEAEIKSIDVAGAALRSYTYKRRAAGLAVVALAYGAVKWWTA